MRDRSDDALHAAAEEARCAGDREREIECLDEAAARHPGHPGILLLRVKCLLLLRRRDEALAGLKRLRTMLAAEPALLDQLGGELLEAREPALALAAYRDLRGSPYPAARAVGLAREAGVLSRLGRKGEARQAVAEAKAFGAALPEVRAAEATLCLREDPARARELWADLAVTSPQVPPAFTVAAARGLATACDALGREEEAMAALATAAEIECATDPAIPGLRAGRAAWRDFHGRAFQPSRADCAAWHEASHGEPAPPHAVMLGHPRSGTTLLEQVLDAHPQVASVEESDHHATAIDAPLIRRHADYGGPRSFGDWLHDLPDGDLRPMRETYFHRLARDAGHPPAGTLLLDKNPAMTTDLRRLPRTLPQARLLVVLRDPRDVCLSACFQTVRRTPWSVNWLTLAEAVEQYVFAMRLWLDMRDRLAQPWLETRYEDLVAEPVAEGRRVTAFLGLDWHPAQEDPAAHARSRHVHSPSHADVREPSHPRAVGKWRRYERWLAPHQRMLAPFVEAFGYPAG